MNETNKTANKTIEIKDIFNAVVKWWWLILLITLVAGGIAYSYSKYFIRPMYTSSGSVCFSSSQTRGLEMDTNALNASQKMLPTCIALLKSDTFTNDIAQKTGLPISGSQVKSAIKVSATKDTEIINISAVHYNKTYAMKIVETVLENASTEIGRVYPAGKVTVIDVAREPKAPSSPNVDKNTMNGLLLGLVLGMGVAFLIEILDNRLKNEEDIIQKYDIPLLGVIPEFE